MTSSYTLDHLRPGTIAQLIAEIIIDHADEMDTGEFTFRTEAARNAYAELLAAGTNIVRAEHFWDLIEEALAREAQ